MNMHMQDSLTKWHVFCARFDMGFCYATVGLFLIYHVTFWVIHFPATPVSAVIIAVVTLYAVKHSTQTLSKYRAQTEYLSESLSTEI